MPTMRARHRAAVLTLVVAVTVGSPCVAAGPHPAAAGAAATGAGPGANALVTDARRGRPVAWTRQVTMNVRFGLRPRRQRQDIRRATRRADVVGWQEINRVAQTRAIQRLRGWSTYWPSGLRPDGDVWRTAENTNPISWRRRVWRLDRGGTWLTSREIAGVVRARHLTFVVLRHRTSGREIVRWNVHFVPNAMNDAPASRKARRRTEWRRAARRTALFVDRASGWGHDAVLGGGDINWRARFIGNRASYDTSHRRIDYLTHVRSRRVEAGAPRFFSAHSDHDRVRVGYVLSR